MKGSIALCLLIGTAVCLDTCAVFNSRRLHKQQSPPWWPLLFCESQKNWWRRYLPFSQCAYCGGKTFCGSATPSAFAA